MRRQSFDSIFGDYFQWLQATANPRVKSGEPALPVRYLKFNEGNFRANLIRRTAVDPGKTAEAHHVLPKTFREIFGPKGFDVHDRKYGSWWDMPSHQKYWRVYNQEWQEFLPSDPGRERATIAKSRYANAFQAGALLMRAAEGAAQAAGPGWELGAFKSAAKWESQMATRGWTPQQISEAMQKGERFAAENLVNQGNAATRYVHPETGRSVVVDNVTREVIHVGGNAFKY